MSSFDDLITQAEAARLRGVTRSAIGDLVKRGKLKKVQKVGAVLFLSRREVLSYTPEVGGRPAGKKEKV